MHTERSFKKRVVHEMHTCLERFLCKGAWPWQPKSQKVIDCKHDRRCFSTIFPLLQVLCNALVPSGIAVMLACHTGGADVLLGMSGMRAATQYLGGFLGA